MTYIRSDDKVFKVKAVVRIHLNLRLRQSHITLLISMFAVEPDFLDQTVGPCHNISIRHFEKSEVLCTKKCKRPHLNTIPLCLQNVHTGQTLPHPLTADVFYG